MHEGSGSVHQFKFLDTQIISQKVQSKFIQHTYIHTYKYLTFIFPNSKLILSIPVQSVW